MDVSLYCCYSIAVRDYLKRNGVRYKIAALNPNSKHLFWVYIRDEKLDELLSKWTTQKE